MICRISMNWCGYRMDLSSQYGGSELLRKAELVLRVESGLRRGFPRLVDVAVSDFAGHEWNAQFEMREHHLGERGFLEHFVSQLMLEVAP